MIASERKTSDKEQKAERVSPERRSIVARASSSHRSDADLLAPPSDHPTRAPDGSGSGAPVPPRPANWARSSEQAPGSSATSGLFIIAPFALASLAAAANKSAGSSMSSGSARISTTVATMPRAGGPSAGRLELSKHQNGNSQRQQAVELKRRSNFRQSYFKQLIIIQRAQPETSPQHDSQDGGQSGQVALTQTTAISYDNRLIRTTESAAGLARTPPVSKASAQLLATILALVLGSACLLSLAGQPVQCKPFQQQAQPLDLAASHNHHHLDLTATTETMTSATDERRPSDRLEATLTGASVDVQDDRLADLRRRLQIALLERQLEQQLQAAASVAQANGGPDDDETIVLVLADNLFPPRPQSIGRLFKRSGISDQRLAEIQMLRALKKQMDKAKMTASTSAGQDGSGQVAS